MSLLCKYNGVSSSQWKYSLDFALWKNTTIKKFIFPPFAFWGLLFHDDESTTITTFYNITSN